MNKASNSSRENQWFHENERDLLDDARRDREQHLETYRRETEKQERDKLRQAHWMRCPKCGNEMKAEQLDGIEIDRCSVCEGIYFDHGELQTILMLKQENRFNFYRHLFGLD